MADMKETSLTAADLPELVRRIRARTPARILAGRSGASYRTETQLNLREAHAAARDAVRAELDLESALGPSFVALWRLFEVSTEARSKEEYLLEPERGRRLPESARQEISKRCTPGADVQLAIGDGLSVTAVAAQVPALLPLLVEGAREHGWTVGQPFVIRHSRVGVLNQIGELLSPTVAVLLIGERPGLATAESLSAYMAYRPRKGHTDADRNLVSNIHARGLSASAAAVTILSLVGRMMRQGASGFAVRDTAEAGFPSKARE
jgi:ethanolamine ammonia-lyase small subunit